MISGKYLQWFLCAVFLLTLATSAQAEHFLAKYQHLEAFSADKTTCNQVFQVIVRAPRTRYFHGRKVKLQRLLGGVRAILNLQCPQTESIIVIGQVKGKEVYRGAASETGDWALVDVATPADASRRAEQPLRPSTAKAPLSKENKTHHAAAHKGERVARSGESAKQNALPKKAQTEEEAGQRDVRTAQAGHLKPVNAAVTAAAEPCRTADPAVASDVFKCMAAAKYRNNGPNIFINNIRTSDCESISRRYLALLTRYGYNRKEAKERLPSCEIFAQAAKEMIGQPLSWASCTGYGKKDAKAHLNDCLTAFVPKHYGSKRKLKEIVGCEQVRNEYEQALKAADPGRKLPGGYTPPNCDDANVLVASWSGKDPRKHPCAGFNSNDIARHVTKCFSAPASVVALRYVKNCVDARRVYEEKLREAYGGLPPGYTMATCSELEPLIAAAEAQRAEAAAQRAKAAQESENAKAAHRVEMNRKANELARQAIREHESTAGAATALVEAARRDRPRSTAGTDQAGQSRMEQRQAQTAPAAPALPSNVSFEGFEQRSVLEALYTGNFDTLTANRNGVLIYVSGMHNAFSDDFIYKYPECTLMLDSRLPKAAANSMLSDMGMGPGANRDSMASAGIRQGLGALIQLARNPSGILQNSMNRKVLQEQAQKDALRLILKYGCKSETITRVYRNARNFVFQADPIVDASVASTGSGSSKPVSVWDRMRSSCIDDYLKASPSSAREKRQFCDCVINGLRNAGINSEERQTLAEKFGLDSMEPIRKRNPRVDPAIRDCWK